MDGEPAGRVVVELISESRIASQRFLDLVVGLGGVRYRNSKVLELMDNYIAIEGVRRLSYGGGESQIAGGEDVLDLERELGSTRLSFDGPGLVSLIVADDKPRNISQRVVAVKGKLVSVEREEGAERPNGTGFAITTGPAPELDGRNIIVGKVVQGEDIVQRISQLPKNKPNTSSPYFQAGKAIGDKRANVAERAFNRPLAKAVIVSAGILPEISV